MMMNDLFISLMLNEFDFFCYHANRLFKTHCSAYGLKFVNFPKQLYLHSSCQLLFHPINITINYYITLASLRVFMLWLICFVLWTAKLVVYFLQVIDGVISFLSSMVIFTFLLFGIFFPS